jgi:hypothetical protein
MYAPLGATVSFLTSLKELADASGLLDPKLRYKDSERKRIRDISLSQVASTWNSVALRFSTDNDKRKLALKYKAVKGNHAAIDSQTVERLAKNAALFLETIEELKVARLEQLQLLIDPGSVSSTPNEHLFASARSGRGRNKSYVEYHRQRPQLIEDILRKSTTPSINIVLSKYEHYAYNPRTDLSFDAVNQLLDMKRKNHSRQKKRKMSADASDVLEYTVSCIKPQPTQNTR